MIDYELIVEVLNPLIISHAARAIYCKPNGANNKVASIRLNIPSKIPGKNNAPPIKPQPDNHRGMSFDL